MTKTALFVLAASLVLTSMLGLVVGSVHAGSDTDSLGTGGLGVDLSDNELSNFQSVAASDFSYTIIDRNNILVEPSNANKVLYAAPSGLQITMGEYFPATGVVVTDGDTDDVLRYDNEQYGFRIDFFNNNGDIVNAMNSVEDHLGSINPSDLTGFELHLSTHHDV